VTLTPLGKAVRCAYQLLDALAGMSVGERSGVLELLLTIAVATLPPASRPVAPPGASEETKLATEPHPGSDAFSTPWWQRWRLWLASLLAIVAVFFLVLDYLWSS
jgi:hypothetical protein